MKIEDIEKNLNALTHWDDKFKYIIELGKKLPHFEETLKTPENKVTGCTSNVWIVINKVENETFEFNASSDASIVKGLIFILLSIINHKTAKEILLTNIEKKFQELKLDQHLSPSRTNGFLSMIKKIQNLTITELKK